MAEVLGYVIGRSEPGEFTFLITCNPIPPLFEYVCVNIHLDGDEVGYAIGQIENIVRENPLISEALVSKPSILSELSSQISLSEKRIAYVKVLGVISSKDNKILAPRYPPTPGSKVFKAPSDLLQKFYELDESRALYIGHLVNRPDVKVFLDVNGFQRHVAILAATGAGKSYTAGIIIEELLKKGATIIAIDPHGDYSYMNLSFDGKSLHKYSDRIKVLSVGPYAFTKEKYYINISELDDDEIAYMAGIPSKAINIRQVISLAIRKLKEKVENYTLEDIIAILEKWARGLVEIREQKNVIQRASFHAIKYLERLRRLRVFASFSIPLSEILKPMHLTVLNLSGVPFEAQDIVVYNLLKRVFEARVNYVTSTPGEKYEFPIFVVLEEAHRFIPPKTQRTTYSSSIIRTIAAEGRKFGVYLIVISQRPSKIDSDVLSQCQSQIVLRIVNPIDQQTIRESSEAFTEVLLKNLPALNVGEAIIVGPIVKCPVMVKIREKRLTYHGGGDLPVANLLKRARKLALREEEI